MKITILSGGSGNDSLIKGLKNFYKDANIKVVVNAYDNGKSTGVCRSITDTLGVSDIRKNHIRMYKSIKDIVDKRYVDFFEGRFNLTSNPLKRSLEVLKSCHIEDNWPDNIDKPGDIIKRFFDLYESKKLTEDYNFDSFCVGNILYAQMYRELGYEKTNSIICNYLGIDDFVILNSFDNVYLGATLDNGTTLDDEGDIVDLASYTNKIKNIYFYPELEHCKLNVHAIDAVINCDLLIISTGTFWSSIYPTVEYGEFYKWINSSGAKKIWAINNEFDKDSYGVTSIDFISEFSNLGLDLSKFTLLINLDAIKELQLSDDRVGKVVKYSMGNTNGKHDGLKYAKSILKIYYGLEYDYDKYLFDFDDTLWSRDYKNDSYLHKLSRDCITMVNDFLSSKSLIVSGNNVDSIMPKLQSIYGLNLDNYNIPMWLMAHASKFTKLSICDTIKEFGIDNYSSLLKDLFNIIDDRSKVIIISASELVTNIRIKPLGNFERDILYRYINENILPKYKNVVAYKTGRSTIDILNKNNSKVDIINREKLKGKKLLYIGDEIDKGNDRDIALKCDNAISTSGVEETNMLIKLLIEEV